MPTQQSRRNFIKTAALAASFPALNILGQNPMPKIIGFSKPFFDSSPTETAEIIQSIGWAGIECPVRSRQPHVKPEKVEEDLPKLVEALKKVGAEISIITTDVRDTSDPAGIKVLKTAAKLGIKRYRLRDMHYDLKRGIPEQLNELRPKLKDLAQLNAELGIQGGLQNHSGGDYVGAPLWDYYDLLKDIDPRHLGICFDIGHATIEGGLSWPIQHKLVEKWICSVFVKDFRWEKGERGGRVEWCPLGEGMVTRAIFKNASAWKFPICQHHEYKLGSKTEMIKAMKKDYEVLRGWLAA